MTAAFMCTVDEGDEVLVPNPSFPAYDACTRIAQGKPVYYRLPADKDFGFDISNFKSQITEKNESCSCNFTVKSDRQDIDGEQNLKQIADALERHGHLSYFG